MDSGDPVTSTRELTLAQSERGHEHQDQADIHVWIDSDDERLAVSLAGNTRLRKLRLTEDEDVIDGREYTKRLQQQFERLHPVPDWADSSNTAHRKKRRRTSMSGSSADESDEDEM